MKLCEHQWDYICDTSLNPHTICIKCNMEYFEYTSQLEKRCEKFRAALDEIIKKTFKDQRFCEDLCTDKLQAIGCSACINNIATDALKGEE